MNKDGRKIRFGLWYDFRNPPQWRQASDRLYSEILDQIAWGENHGFDDVWLSEHHFIEDGYLPSILPVAAAIAARTKQIRIASGVLLMPFHNPVRLAEDVAVVDVISGGIALSSASGPALSWKSSTASPGVPFCRTREREDQIQSRLDIIRRLPQWRDGHPTRAISFNFKNMQSYSGAGFRNRIHTMDWLGGFHWLLLRRSQPATAMASRCRAGPAGGIRQLWGRVEEAESAHRKHSVDSASAVWCPIVSKDPEKTFAEAADQLIIFSGKRLLSMAFRGWTQSPFPSICAIANSCGKAGFSRWSTPTGR